MYVIFLIWQYPDIQVIAIYAFPKIYLDIKMSDFEANNENILAGFTSIHDKMYKLKNTASKLKQDKQKLKI